MTLGEFRALFLGRLNRDDCDAALADGFLGEASARIERELRTPLTEKTLTITAPFGGLSSFPKPADYVEGFEVVVDDVPLRRLAYRAFLRERNARPAVYAVYGDTYQINAAAPEASVVELLYFGRFDALTGDSSTNRLLTEAPFLALYAALSAAGDHFQHEKTPEWEARYADHRDTQQAQATDDEFRGGAQAVAPMYSDPGV